MLETPLNKIHHALGAKMVGFTGWEMPLSYSGVTSEHSAVRHQAGLFDVSHMGRFSLSGPGAEQFLDALIPGPLKKMSRGGALYSMLLNNTGGIIDDIYIYKRGTDHYLIIVNASNRKKDWRWLEKHLGSQQAKDSSTVTLEDQTKETALLALQGPKSGLIMQQIMPFSKTEIGLRKFVEVELLPARGTKSLVARTGYTGERGYELCVPAKSAVAIWQALMEAGQNEGLLPAGLGARDTLRLEMGYPLYGQEMDENKTPIEASLGMFVDMEKSFIGKETLVRQKENGIARKLVGFTLLNRGIPREGHLVYSDQKEIGVVTSGNYSPTLKKGIGMAYIDRRFSDIDSEILVDIRGKAAAAQIVKKPFYRKKK